jgi:hypothetical protein
MAYQSGEFNVPGLNNLTSPAAVAIFNNTLFLFGGSNADANGRMIQSTFSIPNLGTSAESLDTSALTTASNWTTGFMVMSGNTPCTFSRCAAASMPDSLYAFWNHFQYGGLFGGDSLELLASRYSGTSWGDTIKLLESDGKTPPIPQSYVGFPGTLYADVSVTSLGDNLIIVACAQATSATNNQGGIFLGIYDTTNVNTADNSWTADWHTYLSTSQIDSNERFVGTGSQISIDWFSTLAAGSGDLVFYLAISCLPQTSGPSLLPVEPPPAAYMIYVPLTVNTGTGSTSATLDVTNLQSFVEFGLGGSAIPIVRDPAGRLRSYVISNGGSSLTCKQAGYYTTTNPPDPNSSSGLPFDADQFTIAGDVNVLPSTLFYIFTPGATSTTFNGLSATEYPVYEFVFYRGSFTGQINLSGTIQVIPNYSSLTPTPDTVNIIAGIIDGPIPLPLTNYQGYDFGTGEINQGDVTYGTTTTQTVSRSLDSTFTVGISTSGEVTTGIGVAWDLSSNYGMGSVSGNTQQSSLSYNLSQPALVDQGPPPSVSPYGSLRRVSAEINITAYRFLDTNGNPVTDATTDDSGQAPKLATILPTFTQPTALSYTPYSVTPGDLTSYTPEAWNAKMKSLGYTGDNYYEDIISANAYPFGNPEEPYITLSWSEGTTSTGGFTNFTSTYTEQSWTLDASVYAGLSAGGGFEIFGLGEEAQIKVMAGSTVTHESTTAENQETGWLIDVSAGWGPPINTTDPNSVKQYDFRLFFLPVPTPPWSSLPPNYWTQELINNMPAGSDTSGKSIDPNSSCWRIVFVVTSIQYRDPTVTPYSYQGPETKSVYPAEDPTTTES